MSRTALAAAAALLAAAAPAAAQFSDFQPSPRWGSFELSISGYRPNVDASVPADKTKPYATIFGNDRGLMFRGDLAKSLDLGVGTLDVGIGTGYFSKSGKGLKTSDHSPTADDTVLRMIPARVSLTYRFDWLVERHGIPLAPYVRASVERYWWWVTKGTGDTASADGVSGSGAKNGYAFTAGLAFLLDFIDGGLAREMDRDTGINHTYLFADVTKGWIDNFGSSTSWDLAHDGLLVSGGLLFVF